MRRPRGLLILPALLAFLALAPVASAASSPDCPSSIGPVLGGYGDPETDGLDDGTPGEDPLWVAGQLVVSLKRSASTSELRCVARELRATILDGERSSDGLAGMRNTMVLQLDPGVSVAGTMRLLEGRRYERLVRYASPNYEMNTQADPTREPLYSLQWSLNNVKTVPKKTMVPRAKAILDDPGASNAIKDRIRRELMDASEITALTPAADNLLMPNTFAAGRMPFSIQAKRGWSKVPSPGIFDVGGTRVKVGVLDSGLDEHYELDAAVGDRNRFFDLGGRAYNLTVKPRAAGTYQLNVTKSSLGKYASCPIPVRATAAEIQGWLNRAPGICADEVTTYALEMSADEGNFTIRAGSGRFCEHSFDADAAEIEDCLRFGIGIDATDVKVAVKGAKTATSRSLVIFMTKAVADRQRLTFDDSALRLKGDPANGVPASPGNIREMTSYAIGIDADAGTWAIRTATGRTCDRIPYDVLPEKVEECLKQRVGLAASQVKVAFQGGRSATSRTLALTFPTSVADVQRFGFDGRGLKLNGAAGSLEEVPFIANPDTAFSVTPAPAGSDFDYTIDTIDGSSLRLSASITSYQQVDIERGGGVQRLASNNGKWLRTDSTHGAFVAGVIAANPRNRRGITGVVPNNRVDINGLVSRHGAAATAEAIRYAADDVRDDVVNISLSWGRNRVFPADPKVPAPTKLNEPDPVPHDPATAAIASVNNRRTLFVVAAGNEGRNVFNPDPVTDPAALENEYLRQQGRLDEIEPLGADPYPCRPKNGGRPSVLKMPDGTYDRGNIICVGSANWYGEPSDFTTWGAGVVDVAAPGENIVGPNSADGQSFTISDGTSYSAPIVSGIAAMIYQTYPQITEASIVKCAIMSSATTRPLIIFGNGNPADPPEVRDWRTPFREYADANLVGESPGRLPLGKQVFTVNGMVQADEAISAAGSLWSRYRAAVRKNTAKPGCVQRRAGSFWGKGKWVNADDLPPGF